MNTSNVTDAQRVIDITERFLSAWWQAIHGCPVAPTDAPDVPVDAMPTSDHRAAMQAMIGFAECGVRPTEQSLRQVATRHGYVGIEKLGGNQNNDDLIDRIPWLECTAAGIGAYARIVNHEHRRRQRITRLWRRPHSPRRHAGNDRLR